MIQCLCGRAAPPRASSIRQQKIIVGGVNDACGQTATNVLMEPKRRLAPAIQT
jgi:hypothetical protein